MRALSFKFKLPISASLTWLLSSTTASIVPFVDHKKRVYVRTYRHRDATQDVCVRVTQQRRTLVQAVRFESETHFVSKSCIIPYGNCGWQYFYRTAISGRF